MTKRSFLQSLARAAAIVALAPQLAFRTPIRSVVQLPEIDPNPELVVDVWFSDSTMLTVKLGEQFRLPAGTTIDRFQFRTGFTSDGRGAVLVI